MIEFEKTKKEILELIKARNHSSEGFFSLSEISGYGYTKERFLAGLLSLERDGFVSNVIDHNLEVWAPRDAYTLNLIAIDFKVSKDFNVLYKKHYKNHGENEKEVVILKKGVKFDDNKATISIGNTKCQLPPHKNEHFFCRAMFQCPVNEFVDWSIIYENMDKINEFNNKEGANKEKRSVQDTMYALNNRVKEVFNTNNNLFTWKNKSIKRNY